MKIFKTKTYRENFYVVKKILNKQFSNNEKVLIKWEVFRTTNINDTSFYVVDFDLNNFTESKILKIKFLEKTRENEFFIIRATVKIIENEEEKCETITIAKIIVEDSIFSDIINFDYEIIKNKNCEQYNDIINYKFLSLNNFDKIEFTINSGRFIINNTSIESNSILIDAKNEIYSLKNVQSADISIEWLNFKDEDKILFFAFIKDDFIISNGYYKPDLLENILNEDIEIIGDDEIDIDSINYYNLKIKNLNKFLNKKLKVYQFLEDNKFDDNFNFISYLRKKKNQFQFKTEINSINQNEFNYNFQINYNFINKLLVGFLIKIVNNECEKEKIVYKIIKKSINFNLCPSDILINETNSINLEIHEPQCPNDLEIKTDIHLTIDDTICVDDLEITNDIILNEKYEFNDCSEFYEITEGIFCQQLDQFNYYGTTRFYTKKLIYLPEFFYKNFNIKNLVKNNFIGSFDNRYVSGGIAIFYFDFINREVGDFYAYSNFIKFSSLKKQNNQILESFGFNITFQDYYNQQNLNNFLINNKSIIIPTFNELEQYSELNVKTLAYSIEINLNNLNNFNTAEFNKFQTLNHSLIDLMDTLWGENGLIPITSQPGLNADKKIFIPNLILRNKIIFKKFNLNNNNIEFSQIHKASNEKIIRFDLQSHGSIAIFFPIYNNFAPMINLNNNLPVYDPLLNGFKLEIIDIPNHPGNIELKSYDLLDINNKIRLLCVDFITTFYDCETNTIGYYHHRARNSKFATNYDICFN